MGEPAWVLELLAPALPSWALGQLLSGVQPLWEPSTSLALPVIF